MKVETALRMEDADRVQRAKNFQQSDGLHPMTRGFPKPIVVVVRNPDGRPVELTVNQHRILMAGRTLEGETVSAAMIARSIGVATSTVTRALVVLAAFKFLAFDVTRGRYGGFTFLSTAWADMKQRSRRAWSRIKDERAKAEERWLKRLDRSLYFWSGLNVASIEEVGRNIETGRA
jgi:hypothetical protein